MTYDVNTLTKPGRARLRQIAKICEGHGQRVQFSVFECTVNEAQLETLRLRLKKAMLAEEDNLRIYLLRGCREDVVEAYGKDSYVSFRSYAVEAKLRVISMSHLR